MVVSLVSSSAILLLLLLEGGENSMSTAGDYCMTADTRSEGGARVGREELRRAGGERGAAGPAGGRQDASGDRARGQGGRRRFIGAVSDLGDSDGPADSGGRRTAWNGCFSKWRILAC